ncbi:hypothetical protein H257_00853 [Aphanomyces astaci]|uniref:Hemerythrin-like domain-containing protein n=2 Tax=Aphanomyces astaci TaxID=112090 RepID=W4HEC4_APHAT|nr:hypothetical protein H257_00853 [Aphanomyces astaci]ETV89654.1 hypothetical protein H257_00853 [Aphanomyces astaci]|eukprot:XP_009822054.1 hypothetical protein H257_00853 [Aphanomyces astaci]
MTGKKADMAELLRTNNLVNLEGFFESFSIQSHDLASKHNNIVDGQTITKNLVCRAASSPFAARAANNSPSFGQHESQDVLRHPPAQPHDHISREVYGTDTDWMGSDWRSSGGSTTFSCDGRRRRTSTHSCFGNGGKIDDGVGWVHTWSKTSMCRRVFEMLVKKGDMRREVNVSSFHQLGNSLHHHHNIEDHSWFSRLKQLHPESRSEVDILNRDHRKLIELESRVASGNYHALVEFVEHLMDQFNREEMLSVPWLLEGTGEL